MLSAANNDESDEYLKIKYKMIHVEINNNPNNTYIQNKKPTYVATPFPPLNFNHKGKTCPINTDKDDT